MLIDSICEVFQASFSLRQTMIAFVVALRFLFDLCGCRGTQLLSWIVNYYSALAARRHQVVTDRMIVLVFELTPVDDVE